MQIVDTYQMLFDTSTKFYEKNLDSSEILDDNDPIFEDPDAAYDYWVDCDIFESSDKFIKEDLIKEMLETNRIQLDLQKKAKNIYTSNLMKQHSIQMTLFDCLVLYEAFEKQITDWNLEFIDNDSKASKFKLSSKNNVYEVEQNINLLNLIKNREHIGCLNIDFEQQVIEKIYGELNSKMFIIDPIWKFNKTTIDAVKLILGDFSTEIVHHPKHKQTLWFGKNSSNIMAISQNKTYQINQNLYLNKKVFEWSNFKVQSIKWFCPWLHFAILGNWKQY